MKRVSTTTVRLLILLAAASTALPTVAQPDDRHSPTLRTTATPRQEERSLFSALDSGLRPNVIPAGEPFSGWSLVDRMRHYNVPGVAIAVVRNGELAGSLGYGSLQAGSGDQVDGDTLFSVGSISKVVTASTTLRLVAEGRLDLDRNVDDYLTRWSLPASATVAQPRATLRMLMSHTAGFGTPGFEDYQPDDPLPTLLQVLDGQSPAKGSAVRFRNAPGWMQDYSGGGVMVEQMVLEDVTGQSLEDLAQAKVFSPLGMRRSTFESPLSATRSNVARAHNSQGEPSAAPRGWESFAEVGASGLWTSANDLGRLISGLINSYQGRSDFLPQPLATAMMTEVSPGSFGLGPKLAGTGPGRHFFHLGANESYHAFIEGYPETGDGFAILTNGANGNALVLEIRNALADALGLGAHPPVHAVELRLPPSQDFVGRYNLDANVPMDVQRAAADSFEHPAFDINIVDGALQVKLPNQDRPTTLLPLGPAHFALAGLYTFGFEFRRDADGRVRGVTVSMPEANSIRYYGRE